MIKIEMLKPKKFESPDVPYFDSVNLTQTKRVCVGI